jgi:hypothetical protein
MGQLRNPSWARMGIAALHPSYELRTELGAASPPPPDKM